MQLEEVVRQVVRDEVRTAVRQEMDAIRGSMSRAQGELDLDLVSVTQAAADIGVSEGTVRGLQKKNEIKKYKRGRIVLVDRSELRRYFSSPSPTEPQQETPDAWVAKKLGR